MSATTATYRLTVYNDWSQANHKPDAAPFSSVNNPHLTPFGGGTHHAGLVAWDEGQLATPGQTLLQENGVVDSAFTDDDLVGEFDGYVASGLAGSTLAYQRNFNPGDPGVLSLDIDEAFPLVTLTSMIGPSPDWFVGVSGLSLRDADGWKPLVEVDLYPYDGGTRSRDDAFALGGPQEDPPKPIARITDTDDTELLGSVPIGRLTFELVNATLAGDYDGSGQVEQGDLDLVLQNWGVDTGASGVPADWVNDHGGIGQVEQTELDRVLQNWGSTNTPDFRGFAVPEPGSLAAAVSISTLAFRRRR